MMPTSVKVVPVENHLGGVETANDSTRFSTTGEADFNKNDYAVN